MQGGFILAVALLLQVGPVSVFEIDMWPEEGRPVFEAVGPPLQLRAAPSSSSPVIATLAVAAGQRMIFDDTRYRTIVAGAFVAVRDATIEGRDLGNIATLSKADYYSGKFTRMSVDVKRGDSVEYLQYRAEGTCFVRIRSRVIDAALCPNQRPDQFQTTLEPITEWWIHVSAGQSAAGWVIVTAATLKEVERQG